MGFGKNFEPFWAQAAVDADIAVAVNWNAQGADDGEAQLLDALSKAIEPLELGEGEDSAGLFQGQERKSLRYNARTSRQLMWAMEGPLQLAAGPADSIEGIISEIVSSVKCGRISHYEGDYGCGLDMQYTGVGRWLWQIKNPAP